MIGKLIQKKISDALRSLVYYINSKLDNALSLRMWNLRIKSIYSGVSLAEIILRDSLPFYIEEIFILDKKSGILMAHSSRSAEKSIDKDLIGAMLAAINDFIKTSFKSSSEDSVNEIHYGDLKNIAEESHYFFMAIVVYGTPTPEFSNQATPLMWPAGLKVRACPEK